MKYFYLILIAALLGVIIYLYLSRKHIENNPQPVESKAQIHLKANLDTATALISAFRLKAHADSVKYKSSEIAFKSQIQNLKKQITEKKVIAQPVIDSNKDVKELVQFYDSTIFVLESRIDTINQDKAEQWRQFNKLLSESESLLNDVKKDVTIITEESNNWKKKAKKRFGVGPHAGYDVITNRPTIGVSLHYSLFRF
jgi:chromosome segregation ATPase